MSLPTTNLVAHFDASSGVTITGSGVSQWDDQSGQDNHATQTTDSLRPSFLTVDGQDSISFDGSTCLALPAVGSTSRDFCAFIVAEVNEYDTSAHEIPLNLYGSSTNFNYLVNTDDGSSKIKVRNYTSSLRVGTSMVAYGVNSGASSCVVYVGAESEDGDQLTVVNFNAGGMIGALNVGPSFFFDGLIRAVVIYDAEQSTANIQAIRDHLTSTYKCSSATEERFIVCEGDSLTKANAAPHEGYDRQLARLYATQPKLVNTAVGGQSLATMATNATTIVDRELTRNLAYPNQFAILWGGTNDIVGDATLDSLKTNATNWIAGRRSAGAKTVILTTIARSDHTTAHNAIRTAYNDWIKAGSSGADAVADVASDARLQDPTDTTYYRDDEVHLVAAGHAVVAGYVKSAIDSLDPVDVRLEGRYEQNTDIEGEYKTNTDLEGEF